MDRDFIISTIDDEQAYHNTAILIYLKAVHDVLGDASVRIGNSLNQGFFTYIDKKEGQLTSTDIHKIWNRMEAIAARDITINSEQWRAADLAGRWANMGIREKAALMAGRDPDEIVELSEIDGYRNYMYGRVLPDTGCVTSFELRPYRQGLLLRLPNALHGGTIPPYRDDDKLYDAFAESKRMRKHTGIDYLADLNDRIREGEADEVIKASEENQTRVIESIAETIVNEGRRIVLLAGPSSSGKTTTAKRICAAIAERDSEPLYLGTDDYFVERTETPVGADGKPDFEGLDALDLGLFNAQMEALLAGEEVDIPEFDFKEGTKKFGRRITKAGPGQIIVIEGIHSLNDVLTENIPREQKFKIYISPLTQLGIDRHNRISTADARLLRRIVRDNQFRGYDAEATLGNWPKVRAGESVNIFPYSSSADVVINSSTVYETNLLRGYAEPLLRAIPETSGEYTEAQRILQFMKYFDIIEASDAVPDNSILREFIGPRQSIDG